MMMNLKKSITTLAILAATSAPAFAGNLDLTLNSIGLGAITTLSYNGGATWQSDYANVINATVANSTDPILFPNGPTPVFCLELLQNAYIGDTQKYQIVPLAAAPGNPPGNLSFAGQVVVQNMYNIANGQQFLTNEYAQAFQLALWEVTFDGTGTGSLTSGQFRAQVTSPITQAYFNGLFGTASAISNPAFGLINNRYQDFAILDAPDDPNDVSSPGSLALLGLGLVGMTTTNRKRKKL